MHWIALIALGIVVFGDHGSSWLRLDLWSSPAAFLINGFAGILTPLVCLATGFWVAAVRPKDPKAWILLALMVTFASISAPNGPSNALFSRWRSFTASMWGLSMMFFGLYFPNRLPFERKYPWAKWILAAVVVVGGWIGPGQGIGFWLNSLGVSAFFFSFGWRRGTEKNPDARRRLKIIQFGAYVGLVPIFLFIIAGQVLRVNAFRTFPLWVSIPVMVSLAAFPLALAYTVLVERALDVRVFIRSGLQYAMARRGLVVLQIAVFALAGFLAADVIFDPAENRPLKVTALGLAMSAVALSRRGIEWLRGWIDRRFFRDAVNTERMLADLGESTRTFVEARPLVERVANVVREAMRLEGVEMWLNGNLAYATGVTAEELRVPIAAKERTLGYIALGRKKSEEPYCDVDVRLLQNVAGQTALALENGRLTEEVAAEAAKRERLNRELEIAREVQERLFPQTRPPVAGLEYAGKCRPALSVGGDYFDFLELPGEGLGIAIGDVSGKGVASALLMASLQACLRGQTSDGGKDLERLMANINRMIFDVSPVNKYATFFYGQYETATRTLTYVNAGHNPPAILRGDEVLRLEEGGPVVGLFRPAKYGHGTVELRPGDIFIGFTDGVSEAMNAADEEWGEDALIACARAAGEATPEAIIDELMRCADEFANGAPQHDDMTLIVAKVGGQS